MSHQTEQPESQVQVFGPNDRYWVCDRTGNRYHYDMTKIIDAHIKREPDGHSVIFLGFRTTSVLPPETVISPEFDVQVPQLVIEDEEDPF